jgi:hemolysin activation/secretion protein
VRCRLPATRAAVTVIGLLAASGPTCAAKRVAQAEPPASNAEVAPKAAAPAQKPAAPQRFNIDDFEVQGADTLPQLDLEKAIYPFLGPDKTAEDVEKARAALEKAYQDKGYQTVSVAVPQQNVAGGVVILKVTELKVGRLRVKNSRYFDLDKIKEKAPSLREGTVPNFGDVTKDLVSLNQWPDRRVTPALRAGVTPGTVDVDLNVEDKVPVHGSLEFNNREAPNTTSDRLVATLHYDNLWQLGHSLSFTYQVAPERPNDATVYSGSYLARLPNVDWLSFLTYGVKSNSNVATVGGTNVVGPGQIVGERAVITLPSRDNFFHTLSVGLDYKHFDQTVSLASSGFSSPVTYYPVVASYGATFQGEKSTTQFNASVTSNLRLLSSDRDAFDAKRFNASPSFTHFNGDVTHTQELPEGFQIWAKLQGQVADGPLVSSEQFSVGGLDTVRGYLESETLSDTGVVGSAEVRSPDVGSWLQSQMKDENGKAPTFTTFNEWRFFVFADGGHSFILKPLPDQTLQFDLWSYGVGARIKMFSYLNGMIALSMPMISQTFTHAGDPHINFRVWGEF